MSKQSNKNHSSKSDNKFRLTNIGPAGFTRLEYRGNKYDHVNDWMRFLQQWEIWVSKTFPPRMASIVKFGTLPVIEAIDEKELLESMPMADDKLRIMIWETRVKSDARKFAEDSIVLKNELQKYYTNLWLQLAISFQNQVASIKDYTEKSNQYDVLWLWTAIQAICIGTVTVAKKTSTIGTMGLITGIKKGKFKSIHIFYNP